MPRLPPLPAIQLQGTWPTPMRGERRELILREKSLTQGNDGNRIITYKAE